MSLSTAIIVAWGAFGFYWLIAAAGAKRGHHTRGMGPRGVLLITAFLVLRVFRVNTLAVHNPILQAAGVSLLALGLGLAVWARIYLGRNWGMPMTRKEEPELVTAGPYRFVRHPIYSGFLVAILGTALATNLFWLVAFAVLGVYFAYSAHVEEGLLTAAFPATYPRYKARTKMLIPFFV